MQAHYFILMLIAAQILFLDCSSAKKQALLWLLKQQPIYC